MIHFDYLSRITGLRTHDAITAQSLAFTADILENLPPGQHLRIFSQSMSQDRFGYPINPNFLCADMKFRMMNKPSAQSQEKIYLDEKSQQHMDTLAKILSTKNDNQTIHFSLLLSYLIAHEIRTTPGICRLTMTKDDAQNTNVPIETPYDKTLRHEFNRMILDFQAKWKKSPADDKSGPSGPSPH